MMCCSEESLELLEVWYVVECELEALEDDLIEKVREAA